jgi:MHS family alpha-ketoglutarate permease-like MFS transporter
LWFKSIGSESGFYIYASAMAAVSFAAALTMKETRTHSRINED